MKTLCMVAAGILAWLQYALWFGQSGHFAQLRLQAQLDLQEQRVAALAQRNRLLTAEVRALQQDPGALEARARHDLGMVRRGEVFYLVPDTED